MNEAQLVVVLVVITLSVRGWLREWGSGTLGFEWWCSFSSAFKTSNEPVLRILDHCRESRAHKRTINGYVRASKMHTYVYVYEIPALW